MKNEKIIYKNLDRAANTETNTEYCIIFRANTYHPSRLRVLEEVYTSKEAAQQVADQLNNGWREPVYFVIKGKASDIGFGPYNRIAYCK